ncbi:MAG TPA: DUF4105 domain-containing protein [Bacteroidales bacterium]|jgi:hypothetical protein|nr:DUF4105 domain-containing protein [Bacteroidales bacterium]
MKRTILLFSLLLMITPAALVSQEAPAAELYLLTCGPGTETYSIYGHSALRVVIPEKNSDMVYNWGVFDFATSNFAWKFAKGRLKYSLGVTSYDRFLKEYYLEQRWVVSQKLNLHGNEIQKVFDLIAENLKPENVSYKYDFFYDNCSTRIRDLIEKALGEVLVYPPDKPSGELLTFRSLIGKYEKGYPWLQFGTDLLIGSPADKKASFRNAMFLPLELKDGLSECVVRREGKMIPLLTDPVLVVDFPTPAAKEKLLASPLFVLSLLLIAMIIITGTIRARKANDIIDLILYSVFSVLALIMVFFNFFADHIETRWNLNIIWLSPFLFICLINLILKKYRSLWFRVVFFMTTAFLAFIVILPQDINNAFVPLIIIIMLRSSIRAGFAWNPLTLPYLTQL